MGSYRTAKERIYTQNRNCTIRKWGIERLYEPTTIRFFRLIVRNVNYTTLVPEGPSRTCLDWGTLNTEHLASTLYNYSSYHFNFN